MGLGKSFFFFPVCANNHCWSLAVVCWMRTLASTHLILHLDSLRANGHSTSIIALSLRQAYVKAKLAETQHMPHDSEGTRSRA